MAASSERIAAYVMTTEVAPRNDGPALLPLYLMDKEYASGRDFMLVTSKAEIEHAYANGAGYKPAQHPGLHPCPVHARTGLYSCRCAEAPARIQHGQPGLRDVSGKRAYRCQRLRGERLYRCLPGRKQHEDDRPCVLDLHTVRCRHLHAAVHGDSIFKNGFEVL